MTIACAHGLQWSLVLQCWMSNCLFRESSFNHTQQHNLMDKIFEMNHVIL